VTTPTYDLMNLSPNRRAEMPPHGFVELVDTMPRVVPVGHTADHAILRAARVSTGAESKGNAADRGLIRYLVRHRHTTPLEMVELQFRVSMPIFVARQWIRHRTANVNEISGRYTELPEEYWMPPDGWRGQAATNRQGSLGTVDHKASEWSPAMDLNPDDTILGAEGVAFAEYQRRIDSGVSREMARSCLPLSTYTSLYWKIDLHNFLHFTSLRMHSHAQPEIREFATAMYDMVQPMVPWVCEAFMDFHPHMGGMNLSRLEIDALLEMLVDWKCENAPQLSSDATSGEQREWSDKWHRLIKMEPPHVG